MNEADGISQKSMPRMLLFGLLFVAWMFPGLIGRDPWKADEAYSFGLVLNMMETGDLVVPTLGSDPFMEKPPIFYITSAGFAKVFSPPLALHEAARLSCVFYVILTLIFVALTSRELNGPRSGWLAAVLLMGTVGLIHTAHMLMTDLSLLAGYALGLYGVALALRKPLLGGLLCGTGAGLALLSKGLLGPGALGVTVLCLPLLKIWRSRAYLKLLGGITAAVLPWVLIWPVALYHRSPALFHDWFWTNNFGRFLGENGLGPTQSRLFYFWILPGFALPVFPLAIWALWRERKSLFKDPSVQLALLAAVALLAVLSSSRQGRSLYATPLLVPLALLAVRVERGLNTRTIRALNLGTFCFFSLAAGLAWFGWLAQFTGWPAPVLTRIQATLPKFAPVFHGAAFAVALLFTLGWISLAAWHRQEREFVAFHWTCGVALLYLLAMTLWLPVADGNMTYRHDFVGLRQALGDNPGIIGSHGLGEPQRAMLHYYAGIKPWRDETRGKLDCRWMLIEGSDLPGKEPKAPDLSWRLVWAGRHHRELFHLYHLDQAAAWNNPGIQVAVSQTSGF